MPSRMNLRTTTVSAATSNVHPLWVHIGEWSTT